VAPRDERPAVRAEPRRVGSVRHAP
jgi:hypothetical protein